MDLPTTHYDQSQATKDAKTAENMPETIVGHEGILTRISNYLFLFAVFFTPLVFIPSVYAPLDVVKTTFLSVCILLAALLYAIDSLKSKTIVMPRFALGYISIGLLISILISSLMSSNFSKSFIGQGFEIGTASFIFLMFLAGFMVSRMVLRDREVIFKVYSAVFLSFVILALFHIARLLGGADFMTLGVLPSLVATVIGKWYDFGILSAIIGLLSLIGIKFLPLRKGLKRLLVVALIVCAALLFIVNSIFIWAAIALVVLCIGVYEYSLGTPKGTGVKTVTSRLPLISLVVVIIAIVCAWKGDVIALPLVKSIKAEYGEVALPWQLTLDVTSDTLKESPLFGAGPNRFASQYLRFKPTEINQTPFWNSDFSSGVGFLPTTITTLGLVGALLWCLFLIFFIWDGIRALRKTMDPLSKFFVTSSFFSALFLWIIDIVYVPSQVIIFFTFIFTGIFVALLIKERIVTEKQISPRERSLISRLTPLLYSAAIIVLIIWLGVYIKKAVSLTYFQKGIKELNINKSPDGAQAHFKKALSWDTSDVYYQALSEINILKINTLTQELQVATAQNPDAPADQKKVDQIVALITDSVKYTKAAEKIDPKNYYNYLAEARISELGTSLKIQNAYENAKAAYVNAVQLNPYNPQIYLNLARLEATQTRLADAQQYVGRALQLKPNYTEAVFLLSQLQVANNQLKEAVVSTQVAIQLNPNEPLLYFQLGLLDYNDKNYSGAAAALEKAVSLNGQYANARYFLGLSYARLGRNENAISQFEELYKTNADNKEVSFILENLKEGKSPFADVKPPIDNKPEKRKVLPVAEKVEKKTK